MEIAAEEKRSRDAAGEKGAECAAVGLLEGKDGRRRRRHRFLERMIYGRKFSGRISTGRTAAGEGGKEALLLGGNSADRIGKEGRGSRDFRAGVAKTFCGGENGGSKGACIADGGGKHAGEKNDCPDFYGRDFSGENGAARSGRKAENDFYAGSTFCGAGEAENDTDCGRNRACRKSGGSRRSGRAAAGSTEKGTGAGKGCGD